MRRGNIEATRKRPGFPSISRPWRIPADHRVGMRTREFVSVTARGAIPGDAHVCINQRRMPSAPHDQDRTSHRVRIGYTARAGCGCSRHARASNSTNSYLKQTETRNVNLAGGRDDNSQGVARREWVDQPRDDVQWVNRVRGSRSSSGPWHGSECRPCPLEAGTAHESAPRLRT